MADDIVSYCECEHPSHGHATLQRVLGGRLLRRRAITLRPCGFKGCRCTNFTPAPPRPDGDGWRTMRSAPTDGPAVWVEVWTGHEIVRAHYAHGGGEDQPRFGPAWFRDVTGSEGQHLYFAEVHPQPTYWRPLAALAQTTSAR
jgi:hypothetical protein